MYSESIKSDKIYTKLFESDNLETETALFDSICTNRIKTKQIDIISDMRKKKNILYNNISSENLDKIDIAQFNYIDSSENYIGFIAQDIEEYYPELINKDKDGYLSIKYLEIIPLLLDYNKNLKKKINKIEEKINFL